MIETVNGIRRCTCEICKCTCSIFFSRDKRYSTALSLASKAKEADEGVEIIDVEKSNTVFC